MIAVGKNTRHILENITLEQIKSMVSYERVMRILEEGGGNKGRTRQYFCRWRSCKEN